MGRRSPKWAAKAPRHAAFPARPALPARSAATAKQSDAPATANAGSHTFGPPSGSGVLANQSWAHTAPIKSTKTVRVIRAIRMRCPLPLAACTAGKSIPIPK